MTSLSLTLASKLLTSAPDAAARCFKSLLPTCPRYIFKPSGSITSGANERSEKLRSKFLERFCTWNLAFYHFYVVYAAAPFAVLLTVLFRTPQITTAQLPIGPAMKLFVLLAGSALPLWYMAFPPTVPEWQDLTALDHDGIRRPKKHDTFSETQLHSFSSIDALQLGVMALCLLN